MGNVPIYRWRWEEALAVRLPWRPELYTSTRPRPWVLAPYNAMSARRTRDGVTPHESRPHWLANGECRHLSLALGGGAGREAAVACGVVHLDAVAPLGLGDVQRDVGASRDLVEQYIPALITRQAEAQRHGDILFIHAHVLVAQRGAQTLGRLPRLVHGGIWEQHQEFLAAIASEHFARVQRRAHCRGETLQQLIAHGVAEAVIDRLEVVEVDEPDDQRAPGLTGA